MLSLNVDCLLENANLNEALEFLGIRRRCRNESQKTATLLAIDFVKHEQVKTHDRKNRTILLFDSTSISFSARNRCYATTIMGE